MTYGEKPIDLGHRPIDWTEYMRWLYLPVKVAVGDGHGGKEHPWSVALPPNLDPVGPLVEAAIDDYLAGVPGWPTVNWDELYVYVTASRGFATPDNPLNRPGWHCDGFGSEDMNYVWFDRWPTRFAIQPFHDIDPDHAASMDQFEQQLTSEGLVTDLPAQHLYRLTPHVVHTTPVIPAGGGTRSFLKVSCSPHRYNLVGNSHNHLMRYSWPMHPREVLRNDPHRAGQDYVLEDHHGH